MRKYISLLLVLVMVVGCIGVFADESQTSVTNLQAIATTLDYYRDNWHDLSSINSWWSLAALDISGEDLSAEPYLTPDFATMDVTTSPVGTLAKYIISAYSCGVDPRTVIPGRDLVIELKEATIQSVGTEYFIYSMLPAVIALNLAAEPIEQTGIAESILAEQADSGSFGFGDDTDTTALAILALEPLKNIDGVDLVVSKAINFMKTQQLSNGGFKSSYGGDSSNANSTAMAIIAYMSVGEKEAALSALYNLYTFFDVYNGCFTVANKSDKASTEQSLIALCAIGYDGNIFDRLIDPNPAATPIIEIITNNPVFFTYPDGDNDAPAKVSVRIEGKEDTLYKTPSTFRTTKKTAIEVLESLKTAGDIDYTVEYGFISSINGILPSADTTLNYGYWSFIVNNTPAQTGLETQTVKDGDELVFFITDMAPITYWPTVTMSPEEPTEGETVNVSVTGTYYDQDFQERTKALEGVDILIDGYGVMVTNATGNANFTMPSGFGTKELSVVKVRKDNYPEVARYIKKISVMKSGGGEIIETPTANMTIVDYKGTRMLYKRNFEIDPGETALSLLIKSGKTVVTDNSGSYVVSIDGLTEFDQGAKSGWKYAVMSASLDEWLIPGVSSAKYSLQDGMKLCWYYAIDIDEGPDKYIRLAEGVDSSDGGEGSTVEKANFTREKAAEFVKTASALLESSGKSAFLPFSNQLSDESLGEFKSYALQATTLLDIATYSISLNKAGDKTEELINKVQNYTDIDKESTEALAFALIALGCNGAEDNGINTRETIRNQIISRQNTDGSFPDKEGGKGDVSVTAKVLTALAPYDTDVTDKAFTWLKSVQKPSYGFESADGVENSISLSWVVIARVIYNFEYENYANELLNYATDTGVKLVKSGDTDLLATEQAMLAMLAICNQNDGGLFPISASGQNEPVKIDLTKAFKDADDISDWAKEYVLNAVENKVVLGDDDGNFYPQVNVTRAEFVAMLLRAQGVSITGSNSQMFDDVLPMDWYYDVVSKAIELELVQGVADGLFAPNDMITREQTAKIISQLLQKSGNESIPADIDSASEWAKPYILNVFSNKVMEGDGTSFFPLDMLTREMAVKIIMSL